VSIRVGAVVLAGGRGSRLPTAAGKHLEPVRAGGRSAPLIDHVLGRLTGVDEVVVATGFCPERIERHVAGHWPAARCFRVPDVADLPASVAAALTGLAADVTIVVEGDVIVSRRAMAGFVAALRQRGAGPPLRLLAGPKPVEPHRCTFDLTPFGVVRSVRPAVAADPSRLSVLAAAPGAALTADLPALARPGPSLTGLAASMWHCVAAGLLATGRTTLVHLAPDGGVNVNTPAALAEAGRYLERDDTREANHGIPTAG
jgi:CTP:molybdopterin cytidylyltransferase MocA